ncbi:MAG: carbonic anhydrase, partial [Ottowia sp.]|nr:carbonic anhydrase [Ottowia sp.]
MKHIDRLISGFRHFRGHYFENAPQLYRQLREGQRPGCMLIGCSDSRVNPVQLFDCAPGDIFIQRNVANLVPPPGSAGPQGVLAAIEYAVSHLLVSHV